MKFANALNAARKGGMSTKSANRLGRLANEFASPEAFFASPKGTILAQWRRMNPEAKNDLGRGFWKDFDAVRTLLAEPDQAQGAPGSDPLDVVVSVADLKQVGDVMEISGMQDISLREMFLMLETIRKRRPA